MPEVPLCMSLAHCQLCGPRWGEWLSCAQLWMQVRFLVLGLLLHCHEGAAQLQASGGMESHETAVMLPSCRCTQGPPFATQQDLPTHVDTVWCTVQARPSCRPLVAWMS